jgi:hypothetical protein
MQTRLEGRVVLRVVQTQLRKVILLLLHTLLALLHVVLLHFRKQIKQLLQLRAIFHQQLVPLLRRHALDLLQILIEALLQLVIPAYAIRQLQKCGSYCGCSHLSVMLCSSSSTCCACFFSVLTYSSSFPFRLLWNSTISSSFVPVLHQPHAAAKTATARTDDCLARRFLHAHRLEQIHWHVELQQRRPLHGNRRVALHRS